MKIFGFGSKKGVSSFGSSTNLVRDSGHGINFQPRYHIRDKDLREIHKAAIVGNVAKVQHVLLFGKNGLNDRGKMKRTALHLACTNGHSAVVTLLLERKCLLNLSDNENRTVLMKAIECQEEECATLLLEHGADPNVTDVNGNTILHYAVFCQNISLAAKLLSCDANIEARNKDTCDVLQRQPHQELPPFSQDDLTPLLLVIHERRGQMVEFLLKKEANIHAVDKMKRTALMLAVKYESANVVRLLLQQGADIFSQDVFGWTVEEYAVISGFNIFRQLISEYKEKRSKISPENSNPACPEIKVNETNEGFSAIQEKHYPGVHRKEVKKKNDDKWTPEECVIAPIFEKTYSLTGGMLHVNDDSILREVDQGDDRPARKTPYEKKVSDSCEEAKDLLHKNHKLQDELAMLRLEIDALKQHWEKEENYFENMEILKVKNDDLQKAVKLSEETLTKTISHYTGQLNALTAENTMLTSKLENEKESKQRLETEVKSYRSRLAAALHNHDQGQTSKRDLELAFQRARDKWLCLQDKMQFDVANLRDNNEKLSQQLSTVESIFNKLKIKLHHTRDDLREKTLMLERVQRDLSQSECQKQEIEHMYQNEHSKVNTYFRKHKSLEKRLSQLQSENVLLRQQLGNARNRADSKEKVVISIQDHF
ncbi:hypothetical protein MG293_006752 [Ovis ammon polii]|uniref:CCDC144C-like coiled-coil domain-containing protein n=1 Tax=Ovis ammon polii TaxID=230172 RepID=A0AAD4YDH2_OVIAM|nr:hypothetical protein MG293_006752 [Ovis ammon polii]